MLTWNEIFFILKFLTEFLNFSVLISNVVNISITVINKSFLRFSVIFEGVKHSWDKKKFKNTYLDYRQYGRYFLKIPDYRQEARLDTFRVKGMPTYIIAMWMARRDR